MKYFLFLPAVLLCLFFKAAQADDAFFDDLIVNQTQKQQIKEKIMLDESKQKTSDTLNRRLMNLKLKQKKQDFEEPEVVYSVAPFGLLWLAPKQEIENFGVKLRPKTLKDMSQCFSAKNLPKPVHTFENVLVCFGENDSLWRIVAYGMPMDDNKNASQGLKEYQKFYDIFKEKYGNDEEFYTPAAINVDEEVVLPDGTKSHAIKQKFVEKGDDEFKEKLISGESVLYATFHNDSVDVTLVLTANGDGQTFIVVDYQNLRINVLKQKEMIDAL